MKTKCPICGNEVQQISCPNNKEGCCVFHYKCPNCEKEKK